MSVETTNGVGQPRRWQRMLPMAAVALSFTVGSFARYPVPGPNEPHYLCKAKHYWNPDWCPGDLFLSSSNAHVVFYQTFGLLTRWCSLETTAIVGRLVGLLILSAGWTAMIHRLIPGRWPPLWAAWIFLALSAIGNLSGEWLIGGIEAKIPAYGLLFAAIALGLDEEPALRGWRILGVGFLLGLAVSFHPVVGIWGLAAALFASLIKVILSRRSEASPLIGYGWWWVAAAAAAVATSMPGIMAGLKSTSGSSVAADYIQVYYRLAHHLDPVHFESSAWFGYAILMLFWLIARRAMSRREPERWFFWFVVGAGLIALGGYGIGWRNGPPEHIRNFLWPWKGLDFSLRWKLLKFYPFRLFDVLLPIAVAVTVAGLMRRWCEWACQPRFGRHRRTLLRIWVLCAIPAAIAVSRPAADARPAMSAKQLGDWLDVCRWVERNTPQSTLVLTPTQESWAFKWYGQRAEFVSYKDCPQDGPGIIEWNDRLLFVREWAEQNFDGGYTFAETKLLRERGITHILAGRLGPFDFEPTYRNRTFRIYQLAQAPKSSNP